MSMGNPVLTLEYEMTVDDVRTEFRRIRRRLGSRTDFVFRILFASALLLAGINAWKDRDYWFALFCLLTSIYFALSHHVLYWWLLREIERENSTATIRLEVDDRSLLMRNCECRFGNRLWWSRLTKFDEVDGAFELFFDGKSYPILRIPPRAFVDDQQRATFRSLVDQHLPQPAVSQTA